MKKCSNIAVILQEVLQPTCRRDAVGITISNVGAYCTEIQ
jgi:hypothetical protein